MSNQNHKLLYRNGHDNKGDEELATETKSNNKKSGKCLVYFLILLVLQSIALLIFGLVVLRVKPPEMRLSHVKVSNLGHTTTPLASLNATLVAEIEVENKNFGRFKFHETEIRVLYGLTTIGVGNINGGQVDSRDSKGMNATIKVRGNEALSNDVGFRIEIGSGSVKLKSHAMVRGEVRLMKIVNRRRTAVLDCSLVLNLGSHESQDLVCQ